MNGSFLSDQNGCALAGWRRINSRFSYGPWLVTSNGWSSSKRMWWQPHHEEAHRNPPSSHREELYGVNIEGIVSVALSRDGLDRHPPT